MKRPKLRIALIGCGQIADAHLQEIRKIDSAEAVAVCDRHPDLARQAAARFGVPGVFDDLGRIPAQGIQVLLRSVQKDRIAMALKGATADMKDLFFRNLSERAGKMLREEIEAHLALRTVRPRESP